MAMVAPPSDEVFSEPIGRVLTGEADRVVKPREYGRAGIEHYWRVETEPEVVVHTFRLGDEAAYVPTGVFKAGDVIDAPGLTWARVPVDDLLDEG